jgi:hypothetical protein
MEGFKMTKRIVLFAAMILAVFMIVSGCAKGVIDDNDIMSDPISGLIYSIEENRILVIGGIDDVNIPQEKWFESGNRAVYFSITDETVIELNGETVSAERLARGQAVDVFHEGFWLNHTPNRVGH